MLKSFVLCQAPPNIYASHTPMNQSAYMSNVTCADAIFAMQEVVARYVREGSDVYMCLYDLQKAFDFC